MVISNVYVVIQSNYEDKYKDICGDKENVNSNKRSASAYIRCKQMEYDIHTMNTELQYMEKLLGFQSISISKPPVPVSGSYAAGKGINAARTIKSVPTCTSTCRSNLLYYR